MHRRPRPPSGDGPVAPSSRGASRPRPMAPTLTRPTVSLPMLRCSHGFVSCPAGSFATVTSLFDDARGRRARPGRPGRAAGRADAAAGARRGRRPAAPARRPGAAAPAGRVRRADVAGPLRPARHRQDDARARHLAGHQAPVRPALGAGLRGQGGPRGHHRAPSASSPTPAAAPCCSSTRSTASPRPSRTRLLSRGRGPDRQPHRRHHREPVLLRGQPAALAQPRPRAPAAVATTTSARCCTGRSPATAGSTARSRSPTRPRSTCSGSPGGDARKALTALESGAGAAKAVGHRRPGPGDPGDGGRAGRGPLRPAGRPALRRRQRADQEHPRQRRRRRAALPGPDGRGGGGPALHRPAAGHLRQRGHRHGRPDGAADRGRRRRRGRLHRHARGALPAGARRRPPGHGAEVQRRHRRHGRVRRRRPRRAGRPGAARAARRALRRAPRSSATARPTSIRTPTPTASSRSSTRPTRWSGRTTTGPPTAAPRRGSGERLAKLRAIIRRTPLTARPPIGGTDGRTAPATTVTTPDRSTPIDAAGSDAAQPKTENRSARVRRRDRRADRSRRLGAAGGAARGPAAQARAHARRDDADHPAGARAERADPEPGEHHGRPT